MHSPMKHLLPYTSSGPFPSMGYVGEVTNQSNMVRLIAS